MLPDQKVGVRELRGLQGSKRLWQPEYHEIPRGPSEKCPENSRFLELLYAELWMRTLDNTLTKDAKCMVWLMLPERRDMIDPKFWSGGSLVTICHGYCSQMRKYSRLKKRQTAKMTESSLTDISRHPWKPQEHQSGSETGVRDGLGGGIGKFKDRPHFYPWRSENQ